MKRLLGVIVIFYFHRGLRYTDICNCQNSASDDLHVTLQGNLKSNKKNYTNL